MNTCGFCGSEIDYAFCNFCEMELDERYILEDGKRLDQSKSFLGYPNRLEVYCSTKELMEKETLELLCLLREARKIRAEVYNLRKLRHEAEDEAGMTDDVKTLDTQTYSEYEISTRKVWVIENIIKDRLGYYPKRITDNFLGIYLKRIEESEEKQMKMKG